MPDGNVTPCAFLQASIGNILTQDLKTIVEGSELLKRILDRDDRGGRCGTCDARWECGGCRAHAFAESGDPLGEDPQCVYDLSEGPAGRPA